MSTPAQPASSGSNRPFIIAAVVIVLLGVGYCAVKVVGVVRSVGHTFADAQRGMLARTDSTHRVAPGSAVYVGDQKVADIVRVIVIHADTTTPATPPRGTIDSAMQAALRKQLIIYVAAAPTSVADSLALDDRKVIGHVEGTFDADAPVRITLAHDTATPAFSLAPVQLRVPGRTVAINVY